MMIQETIEELRKLKDDLEEISEVYDIKSNDTVFVLNKAIIACEQLRKYRKKAKRWKRKFYEKEEPTTPCDLCVFNPPSSADGKPCTMCPAEKGVSK